jgi:hypothetical protein
MKKLVALEKIEGMFSKITYAHKGDELQFIKEHDDDISMYRNLRTHEPFHCRNEKVGEVEQSEFFLFVDEEKVKTKTNKKTSHSKESGTNQMEMF